MSINLEKDEYIIFEVRKHWFNIFNSILISFIAALVPIFLYSIFSALPLDLKIISDKNITVLFLFLYTIWILMVWIYAFISWTNYYLDVWILTNKNLIDVEQKDIFHREIATMRLSKIQDIKSEVKGLIQTFFNFGSLTVQTSGLDKEFVIHGIENPNHVREQIEKILTQFHDENVNFSTSRHIA